MNEFSEGSVPGPWGIASYETGHLEHEGFEGDGALPATKWGIWNMEEAAGSMALPGGPGDGSGGPIRQRQTERDSS